MGAVINLSEARERLAELVALVARDGNEVLIVADGQTLAKLVPASADHSGRVGESSDGVRAADASSVAPQERARRWQAWVESRPASSAPPLSDEMISRESIYREREDSQL